MDVEELYRADLSFVNLRGANLSSANLEFAALVGTILTGANLRDAIIVMLSVVLTDQKNQFYSNSISSKVKSMVDQVQHLLSQLTVNS